MTAATTSMEKKTPHLIRKWSGVIWLLIEVNLFGGTIFGFPALFQILPQYSIYGDKNNCSSPLMGTIETEISACESQRTRHYQVCP
ncbi:unnamed protein product [Rotaria magnacalcarata]|uniref:Uncharacterized protein n=1 Tax=Rotaria magnacalcarata TaxID=392030 RepID=A0A8S3JJS1_9BILA|nr:unnamed protein product [Rotaria magnacalcarata]CAF5217410.1 unnamed protein product [Rotaria magnacalcarata]